MKQTGLERQADLIVALLFQIKALGLPQPKLEYAFHPTRKFRADMAWPQSEYRLLLECQGGGFTVGKHVRGPGYEEDCARMAEAVCLGYRVIWVTPRMIEDGRAVGWLERLLRVHGAEQRDGYAGAVQVHLEPCRIHGE